MLFRLQQECEDLRQNVNTGVLPKLTVVSCKIHEEKMYSILKDDYLFSFVDDDDMMKCFLNI